MRTLIALTFTLCFMTMTFAASDAVSQDQPCIDANGSDTRLKSVTALIDALPDLRAKSDPALKATLKGIYVELVKLNLEKPTSAEVYFQMARYHRAKSNSWSVMKHLDKALFFNPLHVDALILKGDLFAERFRENILSGFEDSYKRAKLAYEAALKTDGLSKEVEAGIYLRLGDLNDIYELPAKKAEAREYWKKAVDSAPGGTACAAALERLEKVSKATGEDNGA